MANINLNGKYILTKEYVNMITRKDEFKDSEEMKEENKGSNYEDEKREVMLFNPDSKHKDEECINKEVTPGADITDAPGTKTEQDEALFNREEVPEARTELPRKSNSQHQKNWRLEEPMLMLMLLLLQVGVVMKKDNSREIINAAMLNIEYKAGAKVHQDRELYMHKKPELRKVMIKTNSEGKYNEANMVRNWGNVRQERADQLLKLLGFKLIGDEQDLHDDNDHDGSNLKKTQQAVRKTTHG
jgi:hypothetical protein